MPFSLISYISRKKRPRKSATGIKDGLEENGTRIFVWNIPTGITGPPFQTPRLPELSTETTRRVVFQLLFNQTFRKLFVNDKQPSYPFLPSDQTTYSVCGKNTTEHLLKFTLLVRFPILIETFSDLPSLSNQLTKVSKNSRSRHFSSQFSQST